MLRAHLCYTRSATLARRSNASARRAPPPEQQPPPRSRTTSSRLAARGKQPWHFSLPAASRAGCSSSSLARESRLGGPSAPRVGSGVAKHQSPWQPPRQQRPPRQPSPQEQEPGTSATASTGTRRRRRRRAARRRRRHARAREGPRPELAPRWLRKGSTCWTTSLRRGSDPARPRHAHSSLACRRSIIMGASTIGAVPLQR